MFAFESLVIVYNVAALKNAHLTPPTSWGDFTKPEWKGKFSVTTDGVNLYQAMFAEVGHDKTLDLLRAIGGNKPVPYTSHSAALAGVESGQQLGDLSGNGPDAENAKESTKGKVEFVNANPLPLTLDLIDVATNAPHPKAAKVFLDWVTSQAGQQAVIDAAHHGSLRTDVKNNPATWNPSTWSR